MGACASKRSKSRKLEEVEQKYDVLASLFATRAQDLTNIVSEYEASKKAEELAFEEAAELREQLDELEAKYSAFEEEHELEIDEWRVRVERKDEEIVAYQRVVDMRTEERNRAREEADLLKQEVKKLQKVWSWTSED
jgi:excinuclease UvrABC nuclease subunit